MTRIVYVNGEYVREEEAKVSIFDRGFLFADGVYEVTSVLGGKLIDFEGHFMRLTRSLSELQMVNPITSEDLLKVHRELVQKNSVVEGLVYLQVTRGVADRDFAFPDDISPTVVMFTQEKSMSESPLAQRGMKVISIDDQRWGRCDIKTVQLLYPCMGKMMAVASGADDARMVHDGKVTEGTSNNAYIVKNGTIITRELGNEILGGITRSAILRYANLAQMKVEERAFTVEEVISADEAFITSATLFTTPVVEIDGQKIGTGIPGQVSKQLRKIYIEESLKTAI